MPCRLLLEAGHEIDVFYANSNIAPAEEYEKRLTALRDYAGSLGLRVMEGDYDPDAWEHEVAPIGEAIKQYSPALGQQFAKADSSTKNSNNSAVSIESVAELLDDERRRERCQACYRLRLEEAANFAAQSGYDALSTTLAVSPYQFTDVIREELNRAAGIAGIRAIFEDFRPYYREATRISRELGMYRQSYCGCRFSTKEAEATRAFIKQKRKAAKAARAADCNMVPGTELHQGMQ